MKNLSLVIPVFNEAKSLPELYQEIVHELENLQPAPPFEIVFADDGSWDSTLSLLHELQAQDPRIHIVSLRRNFGKSAALSAGFKIAKGDIIITLDADLQDQPSEIPKLLEHLDEGFDLVSGWKSPRCDVWSKRLASRIFNFFTALLTGVPLHDVNSGFKAYRRAVIEEIRVYGEMHRYIPVLASYRGFRVGEVGVKHSPRKHGKSKYGASRLAGGFLDLLTVIILTRYNSKPLHAFGILGLILLIVGFLIELYLSIGWLRGNWISDRPVFLLGILLLIVGIQFIFFGLLAEMIAYSTRRKDDYAEREISLGQPKQGEEIASMIR